MCIRDRDDTLLVEARVRPQDVAFLRPGQHAQVKITAYDFSIYGGLEGILEQISADTIEDKRGGVYYPVSYTHLDVYKRQLLARDRNMSLEDAVKDVCQVYNYISELTQLP